MNHQVAMRIGNRVANAQEKRELRTRIQVFGERVNTRPIHILQRKIRPACGGMPCIEQMSDTRMVQGRHNLAFLKEALPKARCVLTKAQELDGGLLRNFTVRPDRK